MPASQISKPIFLHAAAQQAFRLAHRDCSRRLARSKIRRTPLSDYLKIAIACAHRITPFCSCGCSRGLPRASAATPLLPPPGYPRAPASALVPPVYGYIRRIAAPRILPTAGDVAAVNVCPGGCVASVCAVCIISAGRQLLPLSSTDRPPTGTPAAHHLPGVSTAPPTIRAPLVSVKPRQAVKRAGAGCRVSGAVIL